MFEVACPLRCETKKNVVHTCCPEPYPAVPEDVEGVDGLGDRCCMVLGDGDAGGRLGDVIDCCRGEGRDDEAEAAETGRGGGMGCCSCWRRGDILAGEVVPLLAAAAAATAARWLLVGFAKRAAKVISPPLLFPDAPAWLEVMLFDGCWGTGWPLTNLSSKLDPLVGTTWPLGGSQSAAGVLASKAWKINTSIVKRNSW